jgi:hypothetical protein
MNYSFSAMRVAAVLCVIAAIAIAQTGCGGGSSGAPVAQAQPSPTPSPDTNPSATASPVPTTPTPSATPSQGLIPRMSGTGTVQTFRQQGFTCNQLQPPQPSWNQYDCVKTTANSQQETIDTMGPGDQVANLEADALGMSSGDSAMLLAGVAAMPFTGSQATQARQWIASSISHDDSMTDIGGVHFELVVGSSASIVRLLLN